MNASARLELSELSQIGLVHGNNVLLLPRGRKYVHPLIYPPDKQLNALSAEQTGGELVEINVDRAAVAKIL